MVVVGGVYNWIPGNVIAGGGGGAVIWFNVKLYLPPNTSNSDSKLTLNFIVGKGGLQDKESSPINGTDGSDTIFWYNQSNSQNFLPSGVKHGLFSWTAGGGKVGGIHIVTILLLSEVAAGSI